METFAPFIEKLFENLSEILILLAIAILTACLGRIKNWWKDRAIKKFERGINQNMRVQQLLAEVRVTYSADRASLYQFHNGDYYHSGESIMKCSLTHFVTRTGISNPNSASAIPSTHMLLTLKSLQEKSTLRMKHIEFTDDSFEDNIFTAAGTHTALAASVRDSRRNWIGIVCLSWITEPGELKDNSVLAYSHQIGEFLSKSR